MWRVQNQWHYSLQPKRLGWIGSNLFWESLSRILSGASRGFLNFILEAELMTFCSSFLSIFEPFKGLYNKSECSHISASKTKLKNPPTALKVLRGFHKKFEPIQPGRLVCRGGAIDLELPQLRALLYFCYLLSNCTGCIVQWAAASLHSVIVSAFPSVCLSLYLVICQVIC